MRNAIIIGVAVLVVIGVTVQVSTMYKAKGDLEARVEHYLDFVDDTSIESVKTDLVAEARKFGIDLVPGNIEIIYKDTEQQSYAQKVVGGRLGAQFKNKQIGISVQYVARIVGFPVRQNITAGKIKQVAAPVLPPSKAVQELLDSTP